MEQVYLTDEEFKALPTYAKDQPVAPASPPWKTTDGGPWLFCRWGPGLRVEAAEIAIVSIADRVRLAVEADRKARESYALDVAQQTALAKIAPMLMGELMERFIKEKTLNQRAQVRQRMKALLDLMSVDTEYPEIPALNHDQDTIPRGRRMPPPQAALPGQGYVGLAAPAGIGVVQRAQPDRGNEELRRAVQEQIRRELEAAGGPRPRVLPAPGARAAPGQNDEVEGVMAEEQEL